MNASEREKLTDEQAEKIGREWCAARGKRPHHSARDDRWYWIDEDDGNGGKHANPEGIPAFLMSALGWRDESPHSSEPAAYIALGHAIAECRAAVAVGLTEEDSKDRLEMELNGEKKANALLLSGMESVCEGRDAMKQQLRSIKASCIEIVTQAFSVHVGLSKGAQRIVRDSINAKISSLGETP